MSSTAHNALGRIMLAAPAGARPPAGAENESWQCFRAGLWDFRVGLQSGNSASLQQPTVTLSCSHAAQIQLNKNRSTALEGELKPAGCL